MVEQILAMLLAAAIGAAIPAALSPGAVRRVCEFKPSLRQTYLAFLIGGLCPIAWEQLVQLARRPFMAETPGAAILLGWSFTIFGGLLLIVLAVGYFIRDAEHRPIGFGSGVVVTLLTLVWAAPIALVVWLAYSFYFLPK